MIYGIGVDLCSIDRIRIAIRKEHFVQSVFMAEEIFYAKSKKYPAEHFAASYAAKEALAKAMTCGISKELFQSCLVRRSSHGPEFIFNQEFSIKLKKLGISNVFLSISHETGFAVAMVVLERS